MDKFNYLLLVDKRKGKDNLLSLMLLDLQEDSSSEYNTSFVPLHF